MIDPADNDDPRFIAIASGLLEAAIANYRPAEVYLIRIEGWFDAKWLNFSGKILGALGVHRNPTTVPPFHPHRVLCESHFSIAPDTGAYVRTQASPLHITQSSSQNLPRLISRVSPSAVFFWYSSSTRDLDRGSTMLYHTNQDEGCSWYASFHRSPAWRIDRQRGISATELQHLLLSAAVAK